MGVSRRLLRIVRRKFLRSSDKDIIPPRTSICTSASNQSEEAILRNEATSTTLEDLNLSMPPSSMSIFTEEDVAAMKIQAYFRGHLARRAYRALRSLVKLQALVRGASVRRQSRIALQCMHALIRLQLRFRARQLLSRFGDD